MLLYCSLLLETSCKWKRMRRFPSNDATWPGVQAWLGAPSCRISPLLNAVDIDQYPMNTNPAPPRPTTVMLSHVYPLKDILTAIDRKSVV